MAKAASSEKLRAGFEEHLQQTQGHVDRLETIFAALHTTGRGVKCAAMEGLVEEGGEMIEEKAEPHVKDAGLIAAAQKVEHYEIASYGTLATFAELLGHSEAVDLLRQTLVEETGNRREADGIGGVRNQCRSPGSIVALPTRPKDPDLLGELSEALRRQ